MQRCLEKSPDQRWSDAHELEAALVELQIARGIVTPWDDLPLPMVGDQLRARLAQGMARRSRRSWWVVSAGLGATLLLGAVAGHLMGDRVGEQAVVVEPEPGSAPAALPDDSRIEELTNQTRLAASKAYWVYPAEAGQSTALRWIRVLEAEQGEQAEQAQARADELREEIAGTLVRLGDRYWEEQHGRAFALEFYALALVFVPELPHALERSPLTPTQLADLIARAERGEFSVAELRVAKLMEALADADDEQRRARVVALVEVGGSAWPWHASEQLIELVGGAVGKGERGEGERGEERGEVSERADPAKVAALVSKASAAIGRGRRAEARRLFNEALAVDSTSVEALSGLAELHFEGGEYSRALGFARRASQLRPAVGELHVLVGDCYLKSMRYAKARAAYENAARLNHALAAARLAKLEDLLQ